MNSRAMRPNGLPFGRGSLTGPPNCARRSPEAHHPERASRRAHSTRQRRTRAAHMRATRKRLVMNIRYTPCHCPAAIASLVLTFTSSSICSSGHS
jgi:ABC-type nickel/cobalt efflux system permease component RcnA